MNEKTYKQEIHQIPSFQMILQVLLAQANPYWQDLKQCTRLNVPQLFSCIMVLIKVALLFQALKTQTALLNFAHPSVTGSLLLRSVA